jgi:hypothetical protein
MRRPIVLIGEEAAGQTSLMFWLKAVGNTPTVPRGGRNAPSVAQSKRAGSTSALPQIRELDLAGFRGRHMQDLLIHITGSTTGDLVTHLRGFINNTLLVYMHLDHLDPQVGGNLLGGLRRAFESTSRDTSLRGLALVLMGRDERAFDSEPYSSLADIAEVCRLPRFSREELRLLLAHHWHVAMSEPPDDAVLQEASLLAHRITGGQPLLTQMLLQQWKEGPASLLDAEALARYANRLYRQLRDYPPAALTPWRKRLARMIRHDAQMFAAVRDLQAGREYPIDTDQPHLRAPYLLRSLSLAGWLSPGLDATGSKAVWRFSDLHRFWAGPVLRDPKAFVDAAARSGMGEEARR